ncbi:MAG TPA: NAD-binding protein [Thermoleophilia bacterium]|nr:NAD-binding protein [Thermoleophilia bacterium]
MFVLIVGGGKVGLNTARQLIQLGHEIVVVEQRSTRYEAVAKVIGDEYVVFGDGTEIWVLEKAGLGRADMVVAVTGDDEDNIVIAQIAELKFGVPKVVARVNNPFNQATFDLLGIENTVSATTGMLNLIMHELPTHKFVHLLSLRREKLELVELEVGDNSPFANTLVQDIDLPEGVLLVAILRSGDALVARGHTEILPGDYVICLLPRGQEEELIKVFLPGEEAGRVQDDSELETSEG